MSVQNKYLVPGVRRDRTNLLSVSGQPTEPPPKGIEARVGSDDLREHNQAVPVHDADLLASRVCLHAKMTVVTDFS